MRVTNRRIKINNKWKAGFLGLLIFNGVILLLLLALIFWPVSNNEFPQKSALDEQASSEFYIQTTKQNLNNLVNAYIEKLLEGTDHHYRILLEDDVHLMGELPVFSSTVPLSVRFEPIEQANGDLILQQKSISVGLLELPNKKIMEYMDRFLPMPEWVTIDPDSQEIYVAVTDMDLQGNFAVAVQHMDLEANNITMKLVVPYETLGIQNVSMEAMQDLFQ
ncbi:YpmS family protein [Oceanobacillus jeddahense]|uniref:YpmS family protein n=1 Tax=Oceanobacillus jeddahense TaxID=1462527 RepID=A0ABY5JQV5_9BACI|nr:YpmS family protein [Oceanobacillus jeddahense]UUI02698.1 YpmS family protein [Oceanobacillus jeddahense]